MSGDDVLAQVLETWRTNNRVNLFLIDRIDDEGMKCTLSKRGGRNVVRQFAHLHTVRIWHLENRRAKDLVEGLTRYETYDEPEREALKESFVASGEAVETFLEQCVTGVGNRRCFKKGPIATVGYFVAHESHHRGNILLTLKQSGHGLDQKARHAIWNWDGI